MSDVDAGQIDENDVEVDEATATDDYDFNDGFDVFAEEQVIEDVEPEVEVVPDPAPPEPTVEDEPVVEDVKKEEPEERDPEKIIKALTQTLAEEREKKRVAQEAVKNYSQPKKEELVEFDWEKPEHTLKKMEEGFRSELQTVKLDLSESHARARHEDYGEKYQVFTEMAQTNPAIVAEMLNQVDPAEWAYNQASKRMSLAEIGDDPAAYKAQLKATLKAEVLAELKADGLEKQIEKAATILPPAAANIKGKVAPSGEIVISNDPLGDMWGEDR